MYLKNKKIKIFIIILFSFVASAIYYLSSISNLNEKKFFNYTIIIKPNNIIMFNNFGFLEKKNIISHSEFIDLFLSKINQLETKKICEIKKLNNKKNMFFDYYLSIDKSLNENLKINFNADDICFDKIKLIIYETHKELLNNYIFELNTNQFSQGFFADQLKFISLQIKDKINNLEFNFSSQKKEINKKYKIYLISLCMMIILFLLMSFIFFYKNIFYFFKKIKKENFYKSINKIKSRIRS
jgi:hypothetical protein